jgi:hypothetical protein
MYMPDKSSLPDLPEVVSASASLLELEWMVLMSKESHDRSGP